MQRRAFLEAVGSTVALTGLAGCLAAPGVSPLPAESSDSARTNRGAPAQASFSVLDRSCGTGTDRASVALNDETVIVEGVIVGSDGCAMAELVAASLRDHELTVVVGTFREADSVGCVDCVTDLSYRFETTPEDQVAAVRVLHRSASGEERVVATDAFEPGKVVTP